MSGESLRRTENEKIFVENCPGIDADELYSRFEELRRAAEENRRDRVLELLHIMVPGFRRPEEVNREAAEKNDGM